MINFLNLDFTPLKIEHKKLITELLKKYPENISKYSFTALYSWNSIYSYSLVVLEDETLLISTFHQESGQFHLMQPIGLFSSNCQEQVLDRLTKSSYPVKLFAVSDDFIKKNSSFCSNFNISQEKTLTNYYYLSSNLAFLEGRKFAKKRNLISQAESHYTYQTINLNKTWDDKTKKMVDSIIERSRLTKNSSIDRELLALNTLLENYEALDKEGLLLLLDEKPAAFAIWTELNPNTADICFEKGDRAYKGVYQLINRETAKRIFDEGYEWINREEDLGIEGLREAKTSYFPTQLVPSSILTYKKRVT